MYGNRQQLNQAIYMRNLVRRQALEAGGTPFGGFWGKRKGKKGGGETTRPPQDTRPLPQPLPAPPIPSPAPTGPGTLPPVGYGYYGRQGATSGHGLESVEVPAVYGIGKGRQLDQALMNRAARRQKALFGVALRAFMKTRKGLPLTQTEERALGRVGGKMGLRAFFEPQGIDVETAAEEGEIVEMAPEDEVLAIEELNGGSAALKGETMSFGTIALIAGGLGLGIFLIGRITGKTS